MSHNGIRIDSFNIAVCNIVCINITDHRISRILCQSFLEISISFFTNLRISCLSCFCQIFVYFFVRVAGVVCSLICSEYFVCMIVSIKRASPIRSGMPSVLPSLSVPGFLQIHPYRFPSVPVLARSGHINTYLVSGTYTDHKPTFRHRDSRIRHRPSHPAASRISFDFSGL